MQKKLVYVGSGDEVSAHMALGEIMEFCAGKPVILTPAEHQDFEDFEDFQDFVKPELRSLYIKVWKE